MSAQLIYYSIETFFVFVLQRSLSSRLQMFAFHLPDAITQGEYISGGDVLIQGVQLSYTGTGVPCAGAVSCAKKPACL